ncbi:MAG TPA: cytochrome c maturation protein CcmE [Gaiellaceae bacterium]|nr:cytochrome c maturation protein CcmE [Gaiellaceae bacterium]
MARRSSPARLVIALGVAAMLGVFLVYTSIAGGTPQLAPSELNGRTGQVTIVGKVVAPVQRSGRTIRFRIKDVEGGSSVRLPVTYTGSVPDMFRAGRDISLKGRLRNGTFVGASGTLVTKCPSKYSSKKET